MIAPQDQATKCSWDGQANKCVANNGGPPLPCHYVERCSSSKTCGDCNFHCGGDVNGVCENDKNYVAIPPANRATKCGWDAQKNMCMADHGGPMKPCKYVVELKQTFAGKCSEYATIQQCCDHAKATGASTAGQFNCAASPVSTGTSTDLMPAGCVYDDIPFVSPDPMDFNSKQDSTADCSGGIKCLCVDAPHANINQVPVA